MADSGWKMEDGRWKMEDGRWKGTTKYTKYTKKICAAGRDIIGSDRVVDSSGRSEQCFCVDNDENQIKAMKAVFLSGSRAISQLNQEIRERLARITSQSFYILVGDANGADKALQSFLKENNYAKVTVYCSGKCCRNNIGHWQTYNVEVPAGYKGRDFYTQKDRLMAQLADYGFVLWDGKSPGSIENVINLLKGGKSVLVYFSPDKEFVSVGSVSQLKRLLDRTRFDDREAIEKKIKLERLLSALEGDSQDQMLFDLRWPPEISPEVNL